MREKTFHRLLEGIRRYGLENVSTLSKWIDIPVETARYMIWEELPKHRISVGISVYLSRIGLGSWMVQVTPAQKGYSDATASFLKDSVGLMYLGRILPTNSIFGFVGIPFGEQYKLREQLEHLKDSHVIESYTMDELEWSRYLSFNPDFYDFRNRTWNFDWKDVENNKEPLLTPYSKEDLAPLVDYKDLLILKELQQRVPRTLSKLSKTIGLDQHNLRYHYKSHARRAIQGYYLKLLPKNSNEQQSVMVFFYEPTGEKSLSEARTVALSLPFTTRVWKTEREYCWYVSCPGEYTSGVLSYLNNKFEKIPGRIRFVFLDPKTEFFGTIPYKLFDEAAGVWRYEPKTSLQILKK